MDAASFILGVLFTVAGQCLMIFCAYWMMSRTPAEEE